MTKTNLFLTALSLLLLCNMAHAQHNRSELSIPQIMEGPGFVGISPSQIQWSENSEQIFFNWNPDNEYGDSLYMVSVSTAKVEKVAPRLRRELPLSNRSEYNADRSKKLYIKGGDLYMINLREGYKQQVVNTSEAVRWADFGQNEKQIFFVMDANAYLYDADLGHIRQLTDFQKGNPKNEERKLNAQQQWLQDDQLANFKILQEKKAKREARQKWQQQNENTDEPKMLYRQGKFLDQLRVSPDGRFITYRLYEFAPGTKRTEVMDFVTESGYTKNQSARPKVGQPYALYESWIFDSQQDSVYQVQTNTIPGIRDVPAYLRQEENEGNKKEIPQADKDRDVVVHGPIWSEDGKQAVVVVRAMDNKDRWIMKLNPETGELTLLDRQHDDAWVAGPGIQWWYTQGEVGWMPDNTHFWFQSEESGFSHLYTINVANGRKDALTSGEYEIYEPQLSQDGEWWYFHSNKVHPGERHFYKMPVDGGKEVQLTKMSGRNDVFLSPDEQQMAILHSKSNTPWELFVKPAQANAQPKQLTDSRSEEFKNYNWRKPEHVTYEARDGATVHARLYQPKNPEPNGPAVIFVHGAGYLQNAHKWWSSYYREYMFHNFLVDNGYTVLDIDYRGSAGYGRDVRTGIYRHMGGKDLTDQVDGARFLSEEYGIDPNRLGIYGGSYGGFITLMAMFTQPEVFQAGAALRSVTDWAHYNHSYTSNILNTPVTDSLAYRRSSPIYYAEGLQGGLLICHGMMDDNVQFQDVVRLSQRLIELGKTDWEMAVYPVEPHGFKQPSSWADEYRRIYELFEEYLKKNNM